MVTFDEYLQCYQNIWFLKASVFLVHCSYGVWYFKYIKFSTSLMSMVYLASLGSGIVEDLLFQEKIQESNQKRNHCCQIILMLIRYFKTHLLFIEI